MKYYASERHYFDHLLPVYKETGGEFWVHSELTEYAHGKVDYRIGVPDGLTVVSSYRDLDKVDEAVLMEHGNGQTYCDTDCGSYANSSEGKEKVRLYLAVNEYSANAFRQANPDIEVKVIGCPKLDELVNTPPGDKIAISFHWDCMVSAESMTSFWEYKDILKDLSREFDIIGHAHPRIIEMIRPYYEYAGIEVVDNFDEVLRRSKLYICDNSSTIYEYAACGRPVVLLNSKNYRKDIEHGLRFWDCADVGLQVDSPGDLIDTTYKSLDNFEMREDIINKVYPNLGRATEEAAKWLLQL